MREVVQKIGLILVVVLDIPACSDVGRKCISFRMSLGRVAEKNVQVVMRSMCRIDRHRAVEGGLVGGGDGEVGLCVQVEVFLPKQMQKQESRCGTGPKQKQARAQGPQVEPFVPLDSFSVPCIGYQCCRVQDESARHHEDRT